MKLKHLLALTAFAIIVASFRNGTTFLKAARNPDILAIFTRNRPASLALSGQWLAWTEIDDSNASNTYLRTPIVVYDLIAKERLPIKAFGHPLAISGNQLQVVKAARESADNVDWWSDHDVWAYDLVSGQESLLYADLDNIPLVGIFDWSATPYPDQCKAITDCGEAFYTGCSERITARNLLTNEQLDLGIWPKGSALIDISTDLAVVAEGLGICPVKSYPRLIQVLDLRSGEYGLLSWGSFNGLDGRTIAYGQDPDRTVVLQIEPESPVQVLMNVGGLYGWALLSSDVLVYTPVADGTAPSSPQRGLAAVNFRNGQHQVIDTETYVRSVVADSAHVAWVTQGDKLFVAELHLTPGAPVDFLEIPVPTVGAPFTLHMGTPTWLPPTRLPEIVVTTPKP